MNPQKLILKTAIKKLVKDRLNGKSFSEIIFMLDLRENTIFFSLDGVSNSGGLTEDDTKALKQMIPFKGFYKASGRLRSDSAQVVITSKKRDGSDLIERINL